MYKIFASANMDVNRAVNYDNNEKIQNERYKLLNAIKEVKGHGKSRLSIGYTTPEGFNVDPINKEYSPLETITKYNNYKNASLNGTVYFFDTETKGSPEAWNTPTASGKPTRLDQLNNSVFTVSELALYKREYKDGVPLSEPIKVKDFVSTRSESEYLTYFSELKSLGESNSTSESTIKRFSLYSNPENYWSTGHIKRLENSADISDNKTIIKGIRVFSEMNENTTAKFLVGSDAYNKEVMSIFNEFKKAVTDNNSVLMSLNGDNFDIDVLLEMFKGIVPEKEIEEFMKAASKNHVDIQKIYSSVGRKEIYDLQNKTRADLAKEHERLMSQGKVKEAAEVKNQMDSIRNTLRNEDLVAAARKIDPTISLGEQHVARDDVKSSFKVLEAFTPMLDKNVSIVEKEIIENKKGGSDKLFVPTKNVLAKEDDLFFTTEFNNENVYNPNIMEAGHAYKIEQFSTNSMKNIPDYYKGKKMLVFTDIHSDTGKKSYMLIDSDERIQELIYDEGRVKILNDNKSTRESTKKSYDNAVMNKIKNEKAAFINTNNNKGFKSFENYMKIYNEFVSASEDTTKEAFLKAVKSGIIKTKDGKEEPISKHIKSLSNPKYKNTIVNERAFVAYHMFDDLAKNKDLYDTFISTVNMINDSYDNFALKNGISKNKGRELYEKKRVMTYSEIRKNFDKKLLELIDENDVINHKLKTNEEFNKYYNEEYYSRYLEKNKAVIEKNNGIHNEEVLNRMKKQAHKEFFNTPDIELDLNSEEVINSIFGRTEMLDDIKIIDGIDILNNKGEFTRVNSSNKSQLLQDVSSVIYRTVSDGRNSAVTDRMRVMHANNLAQDLFERGLISNDSFDLITELDTSKSKIDAIVSGILDTKHEMLDYIDTAKSRNIKDYENIILNDYINYSKLDPNEADRLKSYLGNQRINKVFVEKDGYSILGESVTDFLNRKNVSKNTMIDGFYKEVAAKIPEYLSDKADSEAIIEILEDRLRNEFGWNEKNIDNFMNKVWNNKELNSFKYKGSGKEVVGGMSKHIIDTADGKTYFVATPKDKERSLIDKLINDASLEEIQQNALVFEIPKVEEHYGTSIVRTNKSHATAVTSDLKYIVDYSNEGKIPKFVLEDTIDQVVNSLGRKIKYAKEDMENLNFSKANSTAKSSWKAIHDNKTLSAVVTRATLDNNGKVLLSKDLGVSRADMSLSYKPNVNDLINLVDIAVEDPSAKGRALKESLIDALDGEYEANKFISDIISRKNSYDNPNKLENLNITQGTWFRRNISDIVDVVLENSDFVERNADVIPLLETIREVGTKGFYTKDSGEAVKGYFNLKGQDYFVAGITSSGNSRPLADQVMSAPGLFVKDMELLASTELGIKENALKALGIKKSHGYVTGGVLSFIDLINSKGEEQMIGFTTPVKFMTPEEFLKKSNSIIDSINESDFVEIIETMKTKYNINTNIDAIKDAAYRITQSSNLYEDSGIASPLLSSIMPKKTVTTKKIGEGLHFELNSILKPGDIIDRDSSGAPIRYKGPESTIVDIDDGRLILQRTDEYINFKVGLGGSEKLEALTPKVKNRDDAFLLDTVIKYISGDINKGVNIIANPDLIKHEGFTVIASGYFNAINDIVKNESDADKVNELFEKNFKGQDFRVVYDDVNDRYVVAEGIRNNDINANHIQALQNTVDELRKDNTLGKRLSSNIKDIEDLNILFLDLVTMQDNTIQNYQFGQNDGFGAGINHRAQSVMGQYIDISNIDDLIKYKKVVGGDSSILQPIIDYEISQIFNTKKNIEGLQQAQNIRNVLGELIGESKESTKIVDVKLDDAVVVSGKMTAETLPEIFKMSPNNEIHGYRISLDDVYLNNIIYDNLKEQHTTLKEKGITKKINEIIIPALSPNYADENYMLSETQKTASDLINSIYDLKHARYKGSRDKAVERINKNYESYLNALIYDVTNRDGIYKRSLITKSLYSSRHKSGKIAAPVVDEDGRYIDKKFRELSTPVDSKGKVRYRGVVELSPMDIFGDLDNASKIGKDILTKDIDNSVEFLNFLNNNLEKNGMNKLSDIKSAQEALLSNLSKNKGSLGELAINYFEEIGMQSLIMRDPAMLTTSYQSVRIIANRNLQRGMLNSDAVIAKFINQDSDGDEINVFKLFFENDENGKITLRDRTDPIMERLDYIAEISEKGNKEKLDSIKTVASDNPEKASGHVLENYKSTIQENRHETFHIGNGEYNINYITGDNEIANIISRISKDQIGYISNPNYYLRSAAEAYYKDKGELIGSHNKAGISLFTNYTEQSLIDTKGLKNKDDILNLARIISEYSPSLKNMSSSNKSQQRKGVESFYRIITSTLDSTKPPQGIELGFDKALFAAETKDTAIAEAVGRIFKGNAIVGKDGNFTAEEIVSSIYEVLSSDVGKSTYNSAYVSQNSVNYIDGKPVTTYEKIKEITDPEATEHLRDIYKKTTNENLVNKNIKIGDDILKVSDYLYYDKNKNNSNINTIEEGIYKVKGIGVKNGEANIELIEQMTKKIVSVSSSDFSTLSEKLNSFSVANEKILEDVFKIKEDIKNKFFKEATTDAISLENILNYVGNDNNAGTLKQVSLLEMLSDINISDTMDYLNTAEVLNKKGYITDKEKTQFVNNMAERLKEEGDYRQVKKAEMLKMSSLQAKYGVNYSNIDEFIENNLSANNHDLEKLKKHQRVNYERERIETINNFSDYKNIEEIADTIYNPLIDKDLENKKIIESIINKNIHDSDFRKQYLGLNSSEVSKLINNNELQKAASIVSNTKVAYGDYVGLDLSSLTTEQLNNILSEKYYNNAINSGIHKDIVSETMDQVNIMKDLRSKDVHIKKPITSQNITSEMISDIDEKIKSKGKNRRANLETDAASGVMSKIKNSIMNNKKKALIAGGVGAASILTLAALGSGHREEPLKNSSIDIKNQSFNENSVKQDGSGGPKPKFENIPSTDTRFYQSQNIGLNMKVTGNAPTGSSPYELANMLGNPRQSGINTNINISDSRQQVHDRDIDEMVSNMLL